MKGGTRARNRTATAGNGRQCPTFGRLARGKLVDCRGFEPLMSETPDLQSGAVAHAARNPIAIVGSPGTDRTRDALINSQVPYHLATGE